MTIDQGGDDTAVGISGNTPRIIRLGRIMTDALLAVPVALDVQPLVIEPPATVTMRKFIGVVILKGFFLHNSLLL
jgi:hypothetical protein